MKRLNSRGIGHLLIMVAIVVTAVVAVVAIRVSDSGQSQLATSNNAAKSAIPAKLKSTKDLDAAINSLDSSNIDSQLDTAILDTAINNLY
ncbi:MAG: hypothetical protein ABIV43_04165 [Candidatus Saccharimonadales bacterium]